MTKGRAALPGTVVAEQESPKREIAEPQAPPTRCTPVGMIRGKAALVVRVVATQELVFIGLGGPKALDKGEGCASGESSC
jgi:hypothetical protein